MGIKDYFSGIFNISEEEEFEGETFEETSKEYDSDSDIRSKSAPKKFTSARKQGTDNGSAMRMVLVRPEIFSDVAPIADHLKQGKTVVLNLENAEAPAARRIVDFLSGSAYALSFKFKPVSNNTFVIIPDNTDFSGDLLLDDYGSENYFL